MAKKYSVQMKHDGDLKQEFDREVSSMEGQTFIVPKLLAAVFLSIAAIMLAIAVFSTVGSVQTIFKEKSAPGKVVNLVIRSSRDTNTQVVTDFAYPVVEFALPGETPQTVQMMEGSSPPDYAVGDQVTVLYDPRQPRNSRIQSFSSNLLLWLLPLVTFIVGAAFAFVALVLLKGWPPKKWKL